MNLERNVKNLANVIKLIRADWSLGMLAVIWCSSFFLPVGCPTI